MKNKKLIIVIIWYLLGLHAVINYWTSALDLRLKHIPLMTIGAIIGPTWYITDFLSRKNVLDKTSKIIIKKKTK